MKTGEDVHPWESRIESPAPTAAASTCGASQAAARAPAFNSLFAAPSASITLAFQAAANLPRAGKSLNRRFPGRNRSFGRPAARGIAGLLLASLLSACGSGGGDDAGSASTQLSTHLLEFSASAPNAAAPPAQVVTATFGANVAQLSVVHNGSAIARISTRHADRTAQITIEPAAPGSIGPGRFTATVAVTGYTCANAACSSLAAGDTQTVTVRYQVSPLAQIVAPYVATANTADTVIVRGVGFQRFDVDGVSFGANTATAFTVKSDSEITATHPALAAGSYPVRLNVADHEGPVPSTATLVVVEPVAYNAQVLSYPTAAPVIRALRYDAERSALVLGTDAAGGTVLRYPSAGGGAWGSPSSVALGELQDIVLAPNGAQWFALSRTALTPLEPTSLALAAAVPAPSLATNNFLKGIAVANNNVAVVTTGIAGSTSTALYLYDIHNNALVLQSTATNNGTPAAALDGSTVVMIQGDPSLTTDPSVLTYTAASNLFAVAGIALKQNTIPPAVDRTTSRYVLNGTRVYGTSFTLVGKLPDATLAVAIRPDGKRAYTFDGTALHTFDISAAVTDAGAYTPIGSPVTLAGDPGAGVRMTISPDGGALFLAGSTQIVIQPTPAF
jgi:hypothetical protein